MKTRIMRNFILTTALVSACFLTACGGGSGVSSPVPTTATGPTTANQNKATAISSVTFAIPLGITFSGAPSQSLSSRAKKPEFIDASTNGAFTVIFDSSTMLNAIPFQPNGTVTEGETGPSGSGTLPNGGSFTYAVTYTFTNSQGSGSGNQPYADVSFSYTTTPGSHTLGIVETDGPCDGRWSMYHEHERIRSYQRSGHAQSPAWNEQRLDACSQRRDGVRLPLRCGLRWSSGNVRS